MLITITNSNSSPEVEIQWSFTRVTVRILHVYAKTFKSSFGRRGLCDLWTCAHMCLYTNSFLSRIRILKTNYNHHCNDHSNYEFSLVCKVRSRRIAIITMMIQVTNFLSWVTALSLIKWRLFSLFFKCTRSKLRIFHNDWLWNRFFYFFIAEWIKKSIIKNLIDNWSDKQVCKYNNLLILYRLFLRSK